METTEKIALHEIANINAVQISVSFSDKTGFVIPLSQVQAAYLVDKMGLDFDKSNGLPILKTDSEILGNP